MSDNTIKDKDGNSIDVYDNDIQRLADEYVCSLDNKDMIYSASGNCFTGLIKYINKHIGFTNNKDIYNDINVLNNIWDIYVELCYKYLQKPVLEEYCLLIGCSRSTLYTWMNGEYRSGDKCDILGSSRSDTIKKWAEECRIGRYKSAASGNVGGIFLCKAVDGMVETAPVQIINQDHRKTIEQIAQEHGIKSLTTTDNVDIVDAPKAEF